MADLERVGVAGVSLRDLAARIGVSKMAPYRHFPDRESLLAALISIGWVRLAEDLTAATSIPGDPVGALKAMGRAYLNFAMTQPELYRLLFSGDGKGLSGREPCSEAGESFGLLSRQIQLCMAAGRRSGEDASSLVLAYWALVHGIADLAQEGLVHPPEGVDKLGFWASLVDVFDGNGGPSGSR